MVPLVRIPIDKNWSFRQADDPKSQYLPVSQFPTNVHLDLLHHGLIPDPFIGKNELVVQWIGEERWTYRTTFAGQKVPEGAKAVLAFDGLDTFATVMLNGTTVLESDNMFLPYRVDVTETLRQEGENELVITFDSAYLRGWKLVERYPEHKWGCWNGDNSRLAVRKAQYHWVCPRSLVSDLFPLDQRCIFVDNLPGLGLGSDPPYLWPLAPRPSRNLPCPSFRRQHRERSRQVS